MNRRAIAWMLLLAGMAQADTLDVPGQYATIQAALSAASDGDTVVVQPGNYPEALLLPTVNLSVVAPGGAAVTTIDAAGLGKSVIDRPKGTGAHLTLIEGFTITGGAGTLQAKGERVGGGVYAPGSGLTLRACRITGNVLAGPDDEGGGVYGAPKLEQCEVSGNAAGSGGGLSALFGVGGALTGCVVQDNVAQYRGGGLYGQFTLTDCVISGNASAAGGGQYAEFGTPSWTRVSFVGNSASYGGGCFVSASVAAAVALGVFRNNHASVEGGAIYLSSTPDSFFIFNAVRGCTLVDNVTDGGLPTIASHALSDQFVSLRGCTLVGEVLGPQAFVSASILWNMALPLPPGLNIENSDVEGGWPGAGNIAADPQFANLAAGDLHLLPGSPCRNTAGSGSGVPVIDLDGEPRPLEGAWDIGADEFANDCNADGLLDWQQLQAGTLTDCGGDGIPDQCQVFADCNLNGQSDACDIASGRSADCNANGVPDECEILSDCNGNGVNDFCESGDCNGNGIADLCDLLSGSSLDIDHNGVPDECHQILRVPSQVPSLKAALQMAEAGDTIFVEPGVLTGPDNVGLVVTKPLLIAGETDALHCIIDCDEADRAFDVKGDVVTVRNLTIRDGRAAGGGALLAEQGAQLRVLDCRLLDNSGLGATGGAIRVRPGSQLELTRTVLAGNDAANGGALGVEGGLAVVRSCSFHGNEATGAIGPGRGGAVRVAQQAIVTLSDVVAFGDSAGASAELHAQDLGTFLNVAWCDVAGGPAGVGVLNNASFQWGVGNLAADPLFKDPAGHDLRLSGGSPCIDSGDPAGAADADGTPPDIGALPFQPFDDVGNALAGGSVEPTLAGLGTATAGDGLTLQLAGALPFAPSTLVLGASSIFAPFKGGVMVPDVDLVIAPLAVRADGTCEVSGHLPGDLPSGTIAWAQWWIADASGPKGFAASNGLSIEVR